MPTDGVKGRQAGDEDGGSRHTSGGPLALWKQQAANEQVRDMTEEIVLRAM